MAAVEISVVFLQTFASVNMLPSKCRGYSSQKGLLITAIALMCLLCYLFCNKGIKRQVKTNLNNGKNNLVQDSGMFDKKIVIRKNQRTVRSKLNYVARNLLSEEIRKSGLTNEQIEKHLHKYWFLPPSPSPYNLPEKASGKRYFSQRKQDQYVDRYFSEMNNGIFLEVGPYDGVELSNTLYLERERNWTGLLIEPNANFYKELTKVNRKAFTLNACLSLDNKTGIAKFIQAGLIGGVESGYTNTMKERAKKENPEATPADVLCVPVDIILTSLQMYHIHFFSLDVEGAELDILKTIPFDKVQIDLFLIEYEVWNVVRDVSASEKQLKEFREFFNNIKVYREIYLSELDVAFARIL